MFEMSAGKAVSGDDGPVVGEDPDIPHADVYHRFDSKHHSGPQAEIGDPPAVVIRDLRLFPHFPADAVAYQFFNNREAFFQYRGRGLFGDLAPELCGSEERNILAERVFRDVQEFLFLRIYVPDGMGDGGVGAPAVQFYTDVDADDIAAAQFTLRRYTVDDLLVERYAGGCRIGCFAGNALEQRDRFSFNNEALNLCVDLLRGHA
jgi:hypothetical protein